LSRVYVRVPPVLQKVSTARDAGILGPQRSRQAEANRAKKLNDAARIGRRSIPVPEQSAVSKERSRSVLSTAPRPPSAMASRPGSSMSVHSRPGSSLSMDNNSLPPLIDPYEGQPSAPWKAALSGSEPGPKFRANATALAHVEPDESELSVGARAVAEARRKAKALQREETGPAPGTAAYERLKIQQQEQQKLQRDPALGKPSQTERYVVPGEVPSERIGRNYTPTSFGLSPKRILEAALARSNNRLDPSSRGAAAAAGLGLGLNPAGVAAYAAIAQATGAAPAGQLKPLAGRPPRGRPGSKPGAVAAESTGASTSSSPSSSSSSSSSSSTSSATSVFGRGPKPNPFKKPRDASLTGAESAAAAAESSPSLKDIDPHAPVEEEGPDPESTAAMMGAGSAADATAKGKGGGGARRAFLPLELFDNMEYETHTPEEWVAFGMAPNQYGTLARSKFYHKDGTFSWEPCNVMRYNGEQNSFEIEWRASHRRKWVKRLNLIFDAEDEEAHHDRVAEAEELRDECEAVLRYYLFIDDEPSDRVPAMNEEQLDRILHLVAPEFPIAHLPALERVLREVRDDYVRHVKRSIFDYHYMSPAERARLLPLRLPEPVPQPEAPEFGKIVIPRHRFAVHRESIAANLFSARLVFFFFVFFFSLPFSTF
jgi:hypothetical protein